jgi:ParB family transcriptional regulator, chromosome partitioning protein
MEQLRLIPDEPTVPEKIDVALTDLPLDSDLLGDPPAPKMVESIRRFGVLQPIVLVVHAGGYQVAAGRNRIKAARAAGLQIIPAHIYAAGWTAAALLTLTENEHRRRNPAADLRAIEALLAQGASEREICAAVGMAPQALRARLRLQALIPPLRAALDAGTLRTSVAEAAARLAPDHQQQLATALATHGKLRMQDVRQAAQALAANAIRRLPDDLFATPAPTDTDWITQLGNLAEYMLTLIPQDIIELRAAVTQIQALVEQELAR